MRRYTFRTACAVPAACLIATGLIFVMGATNASAFTHLPNLDKAQLETTPRSNASTRGSRKVHETMLPLDRPAAISTPQVIRVAGSISWGRP